MTQLPLAVFAPGVGNVSETFVRKHIEELLPDKTFTVSCFLPNAAWTINTPKHNLCIPKEKNVFTVIQSRIYHYLKYSPERNRLKKELKKYGVRVIMSEFLDWSVQWIDLANELGIKFFAHAHGTDINSRLREEFWRKEYLKYNSTGGVITMSEYSKIQLIEIGINPEKIFVVPYGVNPQPVFTPRTTGATITCLNVGRMIACKSPIYAIDAFRRASEKNPSLRLNYIGGGTYYQAAQQFVNALQMQDRINLLGASPHSVVQKNFSQADIYIQHSVLDPETGMAEGLPVSILEAMSHGLPVVATRLTGIPEAVIDGVTGFLVEPGDSVGMAEKIDLLAKDVDLRNKMGEAGWKRVHEKFSWKIEREKLTSILGLA